MAEYIERKRAIVDACNSLELYPSEYKKLEDSLTKIPAADVAPVRHGRWIKENSRKKSYLWICSNCRKKAYYCGGDGKNAYQYCPNCGAKMDGGNDNG